MPQSATTAHEKAPVFTRGKLFILCAIALHVLILLSREFPIFKWQDALRRATNAYFLFFGFDQTYTVFAPPPEFNLHFFAIITRQSGLMEIWSYPRMDNLNFVEKLFKERYRKFLNDNLSMNIMREHLPPLARYIARQCRNDADQPYTVSIFYVIRPIHLPDQVTNQVTNQQKSNAHDQTTAVPEVQDYNPIWRQRFRDARTTSEGMKEGAHSLITYFVRPEDLK